MSVANSGFLLVIIATPIDHAHCMAIVFSAHAHNFPGRDLRSVYNIIGLRTAALRSSPCCMETMDAAMNDAAKCKARGVCALCALVVRNVPTHRNKNNYNIMDHHVEQVH